MTDAISRISAQNAGRMRKTKTRREFVRQSVMAAGLLTLRRGSVFLTAKLAADKEAISKLRSKFSGRLIVPGDPEYDAARKVIEMNPENDKHPAVVAQCKNDEDILRCIEFAHREQMEVAVRSGNHSILGWGSCDKGIVIDLSSMKGVAVDAVKRTAQARTGNTAEEILVATIKYGLTPVLGECGTVGAGLALAGGFSWLSGQYGATSDNVLGARLITADGRTVKSDANTNEDLFWAIRGGGGNFGVATLLEYQLHPIGEVLAGDLVYPSKNAKPILRFFRDFMANAPDELQAECYLTTHHGGRVSMQSVYSGNLDEGERLLDTFRKFQAPYEDSVKRRSFADIYRLNEDEASFSSPFEYMKDSYLETVPDEAIDLICESFAQAPPSCDVVFNFGHYVHGQLCRVAPEATAFELRKAGAVNLGFWAQWKEQAQASTCTAWVNKTFEQLQPFSGGRVCSNFVSTKDEFTAKRVYGNNYPRLAQLKKKYDPENFFHLNQNVLPKQ